MFTCSETTALCAGLCTGVAVGIWCKARVDASGNRKTISSIGGDTPEPGEISEFPRCFDYPQTGDAREINFVEMFLCFQELLVFCFTDW
jgi:hypothetical protein